MAQEIKRDHFGFGPPRFKAEVYAPITSFAVLIRACIRATFSLGRDREEEMEERKSQKFGQ